MFALLRDQSEELHSLGQALSWDVRDMRGQSKDKRSLKAKARFRTGHCCLCQHAGDWPKQILWPSPKSCAEEIPFVPRTIGTTNSYNKDGVQGVKIGINGAIYHSI